MTPTSAAAGRAGALLAVAAAALLAAGCSTPQTTQTAPSARSASSSAPRSSLVLAAARVEPGPEHHRRDADLGRVQTGRTLLDVVEIHIHDHIRSIDGRPRDHLHQDRSGFRVRRRR